MKCYQSHECVRREWRGKCPESDMRAFTAITFVFTATSCQSPGPFLPQTSCNNLTSFSVTTSLLKAMEFCYIRILSRLREVKLLLSHEHPSVTRGTRISPISTGDDAVEGKSVATFSGSNKKYCVVRVRHADNYEVYRKKVIPLGKPTSVIQFEPRGILEPSRLILRRCSSN
jgi:hypothetical protein